ncbi:hypothetical protein DFH06DRAFT_1295350 [Mycena polygramma]|nr:hypothetical protein DFH06DRAFT_1295350 [Mycena polygramma]
MHGSNNARDANLTRQPLVQYGEEILTLPRHELRGTAVHTNTSAGLFLGFHFVTHSWAANISLTHRDSIYVSQILPTFIRPQISHLSHQIFGVEGPTSSYPREEIAAVEWRQTLLAGLVAPAADPEIRLVGVEVDQGAYTFVKSRVKAHFKLKKLKQRGVKHASVRPTPWHGEGGNSGDNRTGHITVDFLDKHGRHVTTHHVYKDNTHY